MMQCNAGHKTKYLVVEGLRCLRVRGFRRLRAQAKGADEDWMEAHPAAGGWGLRAVGLLVRAKYRAKSMAAYPDHRAYDFLRLALASRHGLEVCSGCGGGGRHRMGRRF